MLINSSNDDFSIFPNPANCYTEIMVPASWSKGNMNVKLMDIAGRSIRKMNVANTASFRIDLDGVAPGMYQVVISNDSEQSAIKLIVQ